MFLSIKYLCGGSTHHRGGKGYHDNSGPTVTRIGGPIATATATRIGTTRTSAGTARIYVITSLVFTIDVSDGSYSIYRGTGGSGIDVIAFPQM